MNRAVTVAAVIAAVANVATAIMVAWFLISQPDISVTGSVRVHGGVFIEGGAKGEAVEVKTADSVPLKVLICEEGGATVPSLFGDRQPMYVKTVNCAALRDLKR